MDKPEHFKANKFKIKINKTGINPFQDCCKHKLPTHYETRLYWAYKKDNCKYFWLYYK